MLGGSFRKDWPLLDCEGQPGSATASIHLPGPQTRVGGLQRICPYHQELHQDLHRRQTRLVSCHAFARQPLHSCNRMIDVQLKVCATADDALMQQFMFNAVRVHSCLLWDQKWFLRLVVVQIAAKFSI